MPHARFFFIKKLKPSQTAAKESKYFNHRARPPQMHAYLLRLQIRAFRNPPYSIQMHRYVMESEGWGLSDRKAVNDRYLPILCLGQLPVLRLSFGDLW